MSSVWCISSRLGRFAILEFDKNCTQKAYLLQKFNFCIFEPKNREVIENSSKTPLNVSSLQYTYLGKNSFQYH